MPRRNKTGSESTQPDAIPQIFIVSDGRGITGARVVQAALVQFGGQKYELVRKANVRTRRQIDRVVREAADAQALIFYTLVSDRTRRAVREISQKLLVPTVDLLGSTLSALNDLFQAAPGTTPGLLYESEREHFDRIEAIDYTLKHDDGQRAHELKDADVVIVGVSRASKSSTCFYLAYQGIRAANVPLFPDLEPLPELISLDPDKVIGLTVNVLRLKRVREARVRSLRLRGMEGYTDKKEIVREVRAANATMARYGWRTIDISYRAIEEIAKQVIQLRESRGRRGR